MGAAIQIADDIGFRVELPHPPARIVSLVPSWTETLFALGFNSEIVGVTGRDRLRFWRVYLGKRRSSWPARWLRRLVVFKWQRYRRHNAKKSA